MSNLILIEKGVITPQAVDYITAIETQMKALKEQYDQFKDDLLKAMEFNGIVKLESENLTINYIGATVAETFDSKQFKADMPDLYDEYIKLSNKKAYVKVSVKK